MNRLEKERLKSERLIKRRNLLKNYKPIENWRTGDYSVYHKHYIIDEKGKLWELIQSFTNDSELWEYFYGEKLRVVKKTEWYEFWLPKYIVIEKPFWDE